MFEESGVSITNASSAFRYLPSVIESMGHDSFSRELIDFLNAAYGAEHCTLFRLSDQKPSEIFAASRDGSDTAHRQFDLYVSRAYWRDDKGIAAALDGGSTAMSGMSRIDIRAMPVGDHRSRLYGSTHIRERVLLWETIGGCTIGLSILRPEERGLATDGEIAELGTVSRVLMAIASKHAEMIESRSRFSLALTSLAEIEETMKSASIQLPKREAQVCARIVFGISTAGIAVDLGVGEETVMTYRKRAYQRLSIGSQRELLLWYVDQWSAVASSRSKWMPVKSLGTATVRH
ncbi:MAG: LuxR C-terminal-related transcriptional regulator [Sphingobium sp.]|uniref:helix-turn-helix transcriptional regulator n=1 Tax=Sphingobium sp. TaxID=1912891 RepID=UPI0029AC4EE6|nr:LuxR C-terminal-related transcriptional regulator [Sphingobium sp.]MDX3911762.1 LuxR C-terminal-related transcriptional regulator [Sphingobium sp.]